jgi:neutral ceramidase
VKYSVVKINITPKSKYPLAGFGIRSNTNVKFGAEELNLSIVRLNCQMNDTVWVSMDTLYFPNELFKFISEVLFRMFSITQEKIIFNATHTHAAPNLFGELFGTFNTEYLDFIKVNFLNNANVLSELRECKVSFWESQLPSGLVINRRKRLKGFFSYILRRNIVMQPNYAVEKKFPLYGIDILGDDEKRILIYSFSCHPTFVNNMGISADFPGYVSRLLERDKYTSAVFMQGFCGDLRPEVISNFSSYFSFRKVVKKIIFQKTFRTAAPVDLARFSNVIADKILEPMNGKPGELIESISTHYKHFSLKAISSDYFKDFRVGFCLINERIVVLSIPAEVLYGFFEFLTGSLPGVKIIPLGFAAGMIGYLPQESDIELGGYEVESAGNYGWPSTICPKSIACFKESLLSEITWMVPTE